MKDNLSLDKDYKQWIEQIKLKIRTVQIKAAIKVNS
jgi:hypothetical protein